MNDEYQNATPSFFPTAVKQGLIIGVIIIILSLVSNLAGLSTNVMASLVLTFLMVVLYAAAAFMAVKSHRDHDLGGTITFGRAFITGLVAALVAGLMTSVFSIVYVQFIDPGSVQDAIDASMEMMEKFGLDEDQIDAARESALESATNPLMILINGTGLAFFFGAIGSLISAAVLKQD